MGADWSEFRRTTSNQNGFGTRATAKRSLFLFPSYRNAWIFASQLLRPVIKKQKEEPYYCCTATSDCALA